MKLKKLAKVIEEDNLSQIILSSSKNGDGIFMVSVQELKRLVKEVEIVGNLKINSLSFHCIKSFINGNGEPISYLNIFIEDWEINQCDISQSIIDWYDSKTHYTFAD